VAVAGHQHSTPDRADGPTHYRLASAGVWRPCRILDISSDGAAVELYDTGPVENFGGRLSLKVAPIAGGGGFVLRTWIRTSARLETGRVLVGVGHQGLTREQLDLLRRLIQLHRG